MASPFISRQDLSDYIGRDVTSDDGALIAIDSACEMVRTFTEQQLDAVTGGTAILDGSGTDTLLLPELPVNAAGTVLVNGTAITDYTLSGNGVLTRGSAGYRNWSHGDLYVWPTGRQNIRVTYDHGWSSVPEDLRLVALSIATRLVVQGPASYEVMGQQQIRYGVNSTDLTNGERALIQKYRRHY